MKAKKIRFRKCKVCENKFEVNPYKPLIPVCGVTCAISYQKKLSEKLKQKKWRDEKKVMIEKLMTHKDYLKLLQVVFNTFIRERDKKHPCISCGCNMEGRKGDASHFYSVGGNSNIRFNELNCHLSCVPCNQFKHGNLLEYAERLPGRIGIENFEKLKQDRNLIVKYSIDEIRIKIREYKKKIAEIN